MSLHRSRSNPTDLSEHTFSLCIAAYRLRSKMPRAVKHDLGAHLCNATVTLAVLATRAYVPARRHQSLEALLEEVNVVWLYLRILHAAESLSTSHYASLSEQVAQVEKQAKAWLSWHKSHSAQSDTQTTTI